MSIFERKLIRKVNVDDTYTFKATIIGTETTQGHTEYVIKVKRDLFSDTSWTVHRRYNDFHLLHQSFHSSGLNMPFPPKKILGNMNRNFIAERQVALQNYLDIVISHPLLSSQLATKKFLDPHNYTNFRELGLTGITIGIRCDDDVKIIKQLPQIGFRLRKEHYLVKIKSDPKQEMILSWLPFGPDCPHDQKQIFLLLKVLASLQHVNIAPLVKVGVCNDGAWIVKEIRKSGSVRDLICGTAKTPWTEPALKKYANYETRKALSPEIIISIVSQILQALAFLHYKGVPYGHLHIGNIAFEEGRVKLLDIETGILGVPNLYRSLLIKVKQMSSIHSVDVFCLGLAMYEMATATPYNSQGDDFSQVPELLRPVLHSILSNKAARTGLPTVADLLNIDLFRQNSSNPKPYIKLTKSAKQSFGACENKAVLRIKEDYCKYRQEKRVLKVSEFLDKSEGQILVCYKKKSKNSELEEINGSHPIERLSSPSNNNSAANSSKATVPCVPLVNNHTDSECDRQALLGAICSFNKDSLKKTSGSHCD